MIKSAEIITKLLPHQEAAVKRGLLRNLILAHSTGSGKTLTAIALADKLGKPATVLTPASLVENFRKEIRKHRRGGARMNVVSLPTAVSRGYQIPEGDTLIIDEAHALRNQGTKRQEYVKSQLARAGRVFALTGTPAYNAVSDWAPLVNMVAKDHVLPETPEAFKERYVKTQRISPSWWDRHVHGATDYEVKSLQRMDELQRKAGPYVDVFETDVDKPQRIDKEIEVPMEGDQLEMYKAVTNQMPRYLQWKVKNSLPPNKEELSSLNSFLAGARQISNTPEMYYDRPVETGAKLKAAATALAAAMKKNPQTRAVVYSNYLDSGLNPYARMLDRRGIKYSMLTGGMSSKEKQKAVDLYNSGKVPVILGSGSASEGLDLRGTRLMQILEPHFNNSRIEQVIGRGIRYGSHSHLPAKDRNVTVERYFSVYPKGGDAEKGAVDRYLDMMAKDKDDLMQGMKKAISEYKEKK